MTRSLSIVIPAYNEEKRLPAALDAIGGYLRSTSWEFSEIVVVDDGSCDTTAEIARSAGARVLENPGNRGKGYSVRHGMLEAAGDWLLFCDADLATPIEELDKLWRIAGSENAPVAIGSRALDRTLIGVHQPWRREALGRVFHWTVRAVTGLTFHDTQCGFKLFERAAAREIFACQRVDGFGFDVEVLYIARRLGYRVLEVPVRWNDIAGTTVSLRRGLSAFADILKARWYHTGPRPRASGQPR